MTQQREVVALLMEANVRVDRANKLGQLPADLTEDEAVLRMIERRLVSMKVKPTPPPPPEEEKEKKVKKKKKKKMAEHCVRFEGLPTDLTEEMLLDQLNRFLKRIGAPKPHRLNLVTDPITARPKGLAYAHFLDMAAVEVAVAGDGKKIEASTICVLYEVPLNTSHPAVAHDHEDEDEDE